MIIEPVVASYSRETYSRIISFLNDTVLNIIADIATSPRRVADVSEDILAELVTMHVLRKESNSVLLDTAVFLETDIKKIVKELSPLAQELSKQITVVGSKFLDASPKITLFLGGIIGFVQGMGTIQPGVDWKNYAGKYAKSKVDFDEVCNAREKVGPDYLNKSVLQGERITAVSIGPRYVESGIPILELNRTDLSGHTIITNEIFMQYEDAVLAITEVASSYYKNKLEDFQQLLKSTIPGQQSVSPANMILNLSRYFRKLTTRELYNSGFFTDSVLEEGSTTVLFENSVKGISHLLK
jgi:hypothetical protein